MAKHVCPWWAGYILSCPLRRLIQNPDKILRPYIIPGITALDAGCAMGFFSLEIAKLIGPEGRLIAVDVQQKMLNSLVRRAKKAGLSDRIEVRACNAESLCIGDLNDSIDFACALNVAHEVPDVLSFFSQIHAALNSEGKFLLAEPKGHVSNSDFKNTLKAAELTGFKSVGSSEIKRSHAALLVKKLS